MDAWVALWILLVLTWAVVGLGFAWVYKTAADKFHQHTRCMQMLQRDIADVQEELTRPPPKRGRA